MQVFNIDNLRRGFKQLLQDEKYKEKIEKDIRNFSVNRDELDKDPY